MDYLRQPQTIPPPALVAAEPAISLRPEVSGTPPAYHGALDYAELEQLGLEPGQILDFSVNSNPYGPSPRVRQALTTVPLDRYPDREALALRRALAESLAVRPDQMVVGNGVAELLWLAAFVFLGRGDRAMVIGPTFGEYARLAALMGAQVETWQARATDRFTVDIDALERRLRSFSPRLAFICNPNNPTGSVLPAEVIATWARAHPHTLFVVDEAYLAFAAEACSVLTEPADNLLILRSMTKDYALAGLRLGYAVSHHRAVVSALARARPAWNVNALAQAAGVAALADQAYQRQTLAELAEAKETLWTDLKGVIGLRPLPSATHYFLVYVGRGGAFRRKLLEQGLLVRDCASFDLPAYVRIATRRPAENDRLLAAIRSLFPSLGEGLGEGIPPNPEEPNY